MKPIKGCVGAVSDVSLPTWERGLKQPVFHTAYITVWVAPYVGAWIETPEHCEQQWNCYVAPYVGAWIETTFAQLDAVGTKVAPYVGAWIETPL